jgi:hypothetical protein
MASNPNLHLLLSKFFIHGHCFTLTPHHEFTIHATQHNDTSLSLACLRAVLAYMGIKFKRQMGRKIGPTCHRQVHGAWWVAANISRIKEWWELVYGLLKSDHVTHWVDPPPRFEEVQASTHWDFFFNLSRHKVLTRPKKNTNNFNFNYLYIKNTNIFLPNKYH